jgi:hypothetical protein
MSSSEPQSRLVRASAIGAIAIAMATFAACGGSRRARIIPTPSLAESPGAAFEMVEIQAAWRIPTLDGRIALKQRLERFLTRFPRDGTAPLAHVYLALLHLDSGNLSAAEAQLTFLDDLVPGATNDFAQVARAEAQRARGRPADALELLRPLAGKLVDRDARERFDEAIVRAALDAHRDYEALAYMDAWLRNTDEHERDAVRERVRGAISKMSTSVLMPALTTMRRRDNPSGYGREIQKLVTARVAELAVENDDAKLAQWLVDADAGSVLSGETEVLVSELATRQAGGTAFIGRTVGLVLSTATSSLRDAAGDVARGLAWALEIPRTKPGAGDDTKLVTRDDSGKRGQLEGVLEELAIEGAGVIVAGMDADSAERAVRWSEATGVPVITLAAPSKARPRTSAFVLGEPVDAVLGALTTALLQRRETRIAPVVDRSNLVAVATALGTKKDKLSFFQPAACEVEQAQGAEARFPAEAWEKEKFRTWLVVGPESCSRDLMREIGDLGGALIALSLEATGKLERGISAHVLSAAAGIVPVKEAGDDDRAGRGRALTRKPVAGASGTRKPTEPAGRTPTQAPDSHEGQPEIERYIATLGSAPNWPSVLGRDAGVLARRALRALPLDAAKSAEEVERRREEVRRGILAARETFWSSEANALNAESHALPRTVRVVELR